MSEQPVLHIELLCLGLRETNRLKSFFAEYDREHFKITAESRFSGVVIVDIDSAIARVDFTAYRETYPDKPALFISFNDPDFNGYMECLRKPLNSDDLIATLTRLYNHVYPASPLPEPVHSDPVAVMTVPQVRTIPMVTDGSGDESVFVDIFGDEEQADIVTEAEKKICGDSTQLVSMEDGLPDIQLSIKGLLLEKLIRLLKSESGNRVISTSRWQKIYFLRERGKIVCNIDSDVLYDLCAGNFSDDVFGSYTEDEVPSGVVAVDAIAFLWQIALWTYRGRIPSDHELDKRVYIAQWPNFTRMIKPPNAMRITSVWLRYTPGLVETAQLLGIPQRHVFSLYSAAYTIGIAGICRRESDNLIEYNTLRTHANHIANQNILNSLE